MAFDREPPVHPSNSAILATDQEVETLDAQYSDHLTFTNAFLTNTESIRPSRDIFPPKYLSLILDA
jgi:hypothetical protein